MGNVAPAQLPACEAGQNVVGNLSCPAWGDRQVASQVERSSSQARSSWIRMAAAAPGPAVQRLAAPQGVPGPDGPGRGIAGGETGTKVDAAPSCVG